MRKIISLAVIGVLGVSLTACGGTGTTEPETQTNTQVPDNTTQVRVRTHDDTITKVTIDGTPCVIYDNYHGGGISCGWVASDPTATDVR